MLGLDNMLHTFKLSISVSLTSLCGDFQPLDSVECYNLHSSTGDSDKPIDFINHKHEV